MGAHNSQYMPYKSPTFPRHEVDMYNERVLYKNKLVREHEKIYQKHEPLRQQYIGLKAKKDLSSEELLKKKEIRSQLLAMNARLATIKEKIEEYQRDKKARRLKNRS